jgi:hypothetical protein
MVLADCEGIDLEGGNHGMGRNSLSGSCIYEMYVEELGSHTRP